MNKFLSAKGRAIDTALMQEKHGAQVALGNANMNARGDIVGRGGVVKKTAKEVEQDYYANNPNAVESKQVSLKDLSDEVVVPTIGDVIDKINSAREAGPEGTPAAPKRKRNVRDAD